VTDSKRPTGWRIAERLAALLEKSITPDAEVSHNIKLPVLGRPGRFRQCDVVIKYGRQPRQSIAIVEVQKRSRKPDINTFHGWLRKMQQVGAQQLICVSEAGYPRSIIEEVALSIGPTVTLMTLESFEKAPYAGVVMLPFMVHTKREWDFVSTSELKYAKEDSEGIPLDFTTEDVAFSIGREGERVSFVQLVSRVLDATGDIPDGTMVDIVFPAENDLWVHYGSHAARVKEWPVRVRIKLTHERRPIDVAQFAYRRESIDGCLAWVASMTLIAEGTARNLNLVFRPDEHGYLQVSWNFGSHGK
jgi:hypothetical protein